MQGVLHPSDIDEAHLGTLAKLPRKQVCWAVQGSLSVLSSLTRARLLPFSVEQLMRPQLQHGDAERANRITHARAALS